MNKTFTSLSLLIFLFISIQSINLLGQSVCCPDFYLSDAKEICPTVGACVFDSTSPIGSDESHLTACQESYHTYTVFPNDISYNYTWTVTGGIPTSTSGNPISILWGTGNQGVITIIITNSALNGTCNDTIVENICLIEGPQADFISSQDTVCVNTPINYYNISFGGSIFFWEFGDGTNSSLSNPPPHSYTSPGTYTVTLTVTDMGQGHWVFDPNGQSETLVPCGCIDTITKTIVVLPGDGPQIDTDCCYGTVCPSDTSEFCTSLTCSPINWTVTGGTIISGIGTNCISVKWDNTYSVPTTVSLESCPGAGCQGITTIDVPVLYPELPIAGPTTVCVGSSGSYSLPTMPGTYYDWFVSGGPYSFNKADRNVTLVNISFMAAGTYWVKCEYHNPLSGCNGVDSVEVNVLPIFTISGSETFCEGDLITFTATDAANWTISPSGSTITSGNGTSTISVLWTAGNYIITATPTNPLSYCNAFAIKEVEALPKPILTIINGPDSVCFDENYTYLISSDTPDETFTWTISSGTGSIMSEMGADNDSVVVQFNSPGPWTLDVYQEIEISSGVFCQSLTETKTIYPYPPPVISGVSTVCVDAVETYVATGSSGASNFNWIISPSSQGTILSGQGTSSVSIKWHGIPTTTSLSVSNCAGSTSFSIVINAPANVAASYNMTPVFCVGDNQTLILSTPSGVGYSYQWFKDGVSVPGGILSSLSINIAPLSIGIYQYYVVVSVNGCSITSNLINVIIKDCSAGGVGGTCDALSYFVPYVVCDSITLVNFSSSILPATIVSYQWNLSGPSPGTFSPNSTVATPSLTVSVSGLYTLSLTVTSSSGCIDVYSDNFTVLLPVSNFTYINPVCENAVATFNAVPNAPGFNYFWDFGDGSTSYDAVTFHSYSPASPLPYLVTLTITDNMGCVATNTLPVIVDPITNCSIAASDTIMCPGDYVVLSTCTLMTTYRWFKDGIEIIGANNYNYNATEYGNYWVETTNSFGCISTSDSIYIYIHSLPKADISGNGHICSSSGSYSGFYLTTPYNANYTYSWSSNTGGVSFSPSTGNSPWASLTLPIALPVDYQIYVSVTNSLTGCVATDTFCVTFFPNPVLVLPFFDECEGNTVVITPSPNDPTQYSYEWSNGATNPVITAIATGTYELTITDLYTGCTITGVAGSINPKPDLSLFPLGCRNVCDSDSLTLYIPLALDAFGMNTTYPYAYPNIEWYEDGNYVTPIGSGETITIPSTNSGSHQITVVVENSFGCSDTSAIFCIDDICCNIVINDLFSGNTSCPEIANGWFTINLDTASTGGPFTISTSPMVPPLPTTITPGVPFTVSNLPTGIYNITITDPSGACTEVLDVYIGFDNETCCFAELDSLFTKISSDITYTTDMVWDGKYYIADNVTVTVTAGAVLDITVVDVVFGECAGIVFENGGYLRANNSVFRPCDIDGSWKGLLFDGFGEFDNIINESTFKNAEVALYFNNLSDGVISNNLFSNCNYGIRVEGNNDFSHPITGNRFVTDEFFPDFSCSTKYIFINNLSTYGIYSTGSKFSYQVSHNQFIDSKLSISFRTYGIYQTLGGGMFSENTFTDMYNSIWLHSQLFYSGIENNKIELNLQPSSWYPSIYVASSEVPIIEINNNEISDNYNHILSYAAIYSSFSSNISIVNNTITGFRYGILAIYNKNSQISNNQINQTQTYGIYIYEQTNSRSYITCNSIKMRNYIGTGFISYNLQSISEVSSNCITDCNISMDFRTSSWGGSNTSLPLIRNNYLYNYTSVGINVQSYSGNIGTVNDPGMNTLYSNNNSAIDINSTSTIYVADNFGMFNISFPQVQITSNNPYHSTASCGHQIFNMPSQGNLNIDYNCDNFLNISSTMLMGNGSFKLMENYREILNSSQNQFNEANMILSCIKSADIDLLNDIIRNTSLSENEQLLLKYSFYFRNSDYPNARLFMNLFNTENEEADDFKILRLIDIDIKEYGWFSLSDENMSILNNIREKESLNSNFAISLLNNTSTYRDYIIEEPIVKAAQLSDNFKNTNEVNYLNIYPNPTSGKVFIELITNSKEDTKLEILDVCGKMIKGYSINFVAGGIELNIEELSDGYYFITLTSDTGIVQKGKIVKVNSK